MEKKHERLTLTVHYAINASANDYGIISSPSISTRVTLWSMSTNAHRRYTSKEGNLTDFSAVW